MKKKLLVLGLLATCLTACNTQSIKSICRTYVNDDGYLIVVYNDGTEENAGYVKGDKGEQGIQGQPGQDGKDGLDGKDGVDGKDGQDGEVIYIYDEPEQPVEPEVVEPEVELYTAELSLDELTPSNPMNNAGFNYVDFNASLTTLNNSKKKLNDSIRSCKDKGYSELAEMYQEAYNAVCKLIQFKTIIDIRAETNPGYTGLVSGRMKTNKGYNIHSILLGSSQLMATQIVQDKDFNSITAYEYNMPTHVYSSKWTWSNLQDKDVTLTFNSHETSAGIHYGGAETIRVSYSKES